MNVREGVNVCECIFDREMAVQTKIFIGSQRRVELEY